MNLWLISDLGMCFDWLFQHNLLSAIHTNTIRRLLAKAVSAHNANGNSRYGPDDAKEKTDDAKYQSTDERV